MPLQHEDIDYHVMLDHELLTTKDKEKIMRKFDTGATRDSEGGKLDYEGFLSPQALKRYAEYMHKHRTQADGNVRDSDNWQKGIPIVVYMKSMFRHLIELWTAHRLRKNNPGDRGAATTEQDALCAIIFNAFGYLHEHLKLEAIPSDRCAGGLCRECEHDCPDPPSKVKEKEVVESRLARTVRICSECHGISCDECERLDGKCRASAALKD